MGAAMVVLVFPAAQLRGELAGCPERRAALEVLRSTLPLISGQPGGICPMGDSKITEMPSEFGAELVEREEKGGRYRISG